MFKVSLICLAHDFTMTRLDIVCFFLLQWSKLSVVYRCPSLLESWKFPKMKVNLQIMQNWTIYDHFSIESYWSWIKGFMSCSSIPSQDVQVWVMSMSSSYRILFQSLCSPTTTDAVSCMNNIIFDNFADPLWSIGVKVFFFE
jgi:hypothetical protein